MIRHLNRIRARAAQRGKSWCGGCDAALVGPGSRCPKCGRRQLPRRAKKEDASWMDEDSILAGEIDVIMEEDIDTGGEYVPWRHIVRNGEQERAHNEQG